MNIKHKNKHNCDAIFFFFGTILCLSIGIYLFYIVFNATPPAIIGISKILTYGKPRLIIYILILTLLIFPLIITEYCFNSQKGHRKLKFIFLQLFCIGFILFTLHNSFYILTDKNIYYRCLIKNTVYTFDDVNHIQFNFIPEKSTKTGHLDPSYDVEITLNDNTHFKLNRDPKNYYFKGSDDFIEFDKQCINAEKNVATQLTYKDNSILVLYWGFKDSEYILKNYIAN